ncbi:sensor histidine kinase [Ohessyouella blattaphilus]|uniref:Sensor histidine kinase n=1 Tax=Ohessyouella blattaphilus TaxID=2949333 RepID=A0ABT1EFS2_9FIRM|nr:sensor histidine kinase [Ohessyouella blattaphilus]MCP1109554.1 sensor histidine kinase [Ohessyouella blattaphilus]MCR8562948.1 sensor histidine kinase [Ohessyouella blattaphilus]
MKSNEKENKSNRLIKKRLTSVSIREKIILVFVGVIFLSMSLLGVITFSNAYISTKKSLLNKLDTTVTAVSKVVDQSFLISKNTLFQCAGVNGVQSWLKDDTFYDRENPEFHLRKMTFNTELQRMMAYSNVRDMHIIDYVTVFDENEMLVHLDLELIGETRSQAGSFQAYQAVKDSEEYIHSELITEPENLIFNVRKLRSNYNDEDIPMTLMLATKERNVYMQYADLLQEEETIVYLLDDKDRIISSNIESKIGEYVDDDLIEYVDKGCAEIKQDQKYLLTVRNMENSGEGIRLLYLYPKKLLTASVMQSMSAYVVMCIGLIIGSVIVVLFVGFKSTSFLNEFLFAMKSVGEHNYEIKIKEYKDPEINSLAVAFNEMVTEIKELIQNKYESQILLKDMEINFLQHQINPHFLFNVLFTIQIKAKQCKDETIYKMVSALSSLLRASIQTKNTDMITVQQELDYTEFYLYLQTIRFEGRIVYHIDIEEDSLCSKTIPKFIIEPIVENAVIHGIENMENVGRIEISLRRQGDNLLILVKDDGIGFDVKEYLKTWDKADESEANISTREKIGLRNVHLRIQHIYGEEYGIDIESERDKGTSIQIKVPIREDERCIKL